MVRLRNEDTKSSLKCNTARSQLNYKSIQIEKLFLTDVSKSWHSINLPLHIWEWTKFSTKAPPVPVGWDPKICYALSNFNNAASSLPNSIPLQLPLLITHNSVWRHFNYFKTAQIDEAFYVRSAMLCDKKASIHCHLFYFWPTPHKDKTFFAPSR